MNINEKLFQEFQAFCVPYIHCWDIDPVYPVLVELFRRRGYTMEQKIWYTMIYVIWYHLGSAERMFTECPEPAPDIGVGIMSTGTERRGFRGATGARKALKLIHSVVRNCTPLESWVEENTYPGGMTGWNNMYKEFQDFPGNGPWAAYKWCDLVKNVLGFNITAPDIGVGGGGEHAGPVPGLVQLTGEVWKTCANDIKLQREFYDECHARGIPFDGLEELETALCDFNSLTHGRYYVGHDIDLQQEQFIREEVGPDYWEARKTVLPPEYLGELGGWTGVRKERLKLIITSDGGR